MDTMRIEVVVENVHTTRGKLLSGERMTLPRDEAERLIARDMAKGVPGRKPAEEQPGEPVEVDYTNLSREQLALGGETIRTPAEVDPC